MIHRWPERRPDRPLAHDLNAVFDRGPKPQRSPGRLRRRLIPWLLLPGCWFLLVMDWLWLRLVMIGAKPYDDDAFEFLGFESGYWPGPRTEEPNDSLLTGIVITYHPNGTKTYDARGKTEEIPHV